MEPLSIRASLVGLTSTAAKASSQLSILRGQVDSKEVLSLGHEVQSIVSVLKLLLDPDLFAEKSLSGTVQVDLLIDYGVLVFSELEALLSKLDPPTARSGFETFRFKTRRYSEDSQRILSRLQAFNNSMSLVIQILQLKTSMYGKPCTLIRDTFKIILMSNLPSQLDGAQEQLKVSVADLLKNNQELSRILAALGPVLDVDAHSSSPALSDELAGSEWRADTAYSGARGHSAAASIGSKYERPEFESYLMASHVYRRTVDGSLDGVSTRDSEGQADGWSYLSHFSLSDISNIGAVHLPFVDPHHAISDAPHRGSDGEMGSPDVVKGRAFTIPDSGYGTASKTGTLTYQPLQDQDTEYSDIASVVTDNLSLDLSRETGNAYVDAFVDRILEATSQLSADEILQSQLIQKLPDLLRSFALRVAFAERMTDGRAVGVFTRQNRE